MTSKRVAIFLASALALASALPAQAGAEEIVIGLTTALTGAGAATGRQVAAGAEQAVREVNDAGGVKGNKIKLLVEDDRSQPDRRYAHRLCEDRGQTRQTGDHLSE
jgi:branched-chain amino acid transport system substrate-binding protein